MNISREQFEILKSGAPLPDMDASEVIAELCKMVESANDHLHNVNVLRRKYLDLDGFICDQVMMSCLAIKDGISEKESIKNIFEYYENNCT